MVFLLLGLGADLLVPVFIGEVVDLLRENKPDAYEKIAQYCWIMALVIIFSGIAVGLRASTFNVLSERIAKNLRNDFYSSIVDKDIAFFDNNRTGALVSRLNSDVQVIQNSLGTNISMFVRGSLFIIITLVLMYILSPPLTLVVFIAVFPLFFTAAGLVRLMRWVQMRIQQEKAAMATIAEESFSNVRTVKAFNCEMNEIDRFKEGNESVYQMGRRKALYMSSFMFLQTLLLYISMAAIVYVASNLHKNFDIEIGEITTFLSYMTKLMWNFMMISFTFGNVSAVVGASDKLVQMMDHKPLVNARGGDKIEGEITGRIEIKNVKFHYPSKPEIKILDGVSFSVDNVKNRVVALCGTSGCGKSSIISLIERFYDPTEGEILFNGRNLKELDPEWYHNQVAIVQQEPILFSGTIGENILYGLDTADKTDDEITKMMDQATKDASAYDFIHDPDQFPLAYDTVVGERGVKLSGGQKQRIAIARALIRKPKLLLLDEATSALDTQSEAAVQKALDKLISAGQQTVVVIAHRLSTI